MGRISNLASCICCFKSSDRFSSPERNTALSPLPSTQPNAESGEQNASPTLGCAAQNHAGEPGTRVGGWDKAYDALREKESSLVANYEKLVSQKLAPDEASSGSSIEIETSYSDRRMQMEKIAQTAMAETEREFKTKSSLDEAMKIVDLARNIGSTIVQGFPQAALPWAGVCSALLLFQNPLKESKAQLDGMMRVITRIEWYCELDDQLSRKTSTAIDSSSGLLALLETKTVSLFEALLAFLMRSVCSCSKSRILETLRDALKLNQWEENLNNIKSLDEEVLRDASYQGIAETRSNLRRLLVSAEEKESQFLQEVQELLISLRSEQRTERDSQSMRALRLGEPRLQKSSIENSKGRKSIVEGSKGRRPEEFGKWIRETHEFGAWREADKSSILWIHGDPGKGKTMLLCEIIDSLESSLLKLDTLSYFFCQATDPTSNTFAAILRGLIFDLAEKRPCLIRHVEEAYRHAGANAFSEEGSWIKLTEILLGMADSLAPDIVYIVLDAVDECQKDRDQLLRFIVGKASAQPNIKWILSSRNWDDIQQALGGMKHVMRLSLEDNAGNVSQAVHTFIEERVKDLAKDKNYDTEFEETVKCRLLQDAQGTFLWVSLVCERLSATHPGPVWAQSELEDSPPGLKGLYDNMMGRIMNQKHRDLCLQIIACVALMYRPVTLQELVACLDLPDKLTRFASTNEQLVEAITPVVKFSCSFLTLRGDFIHFVHQSAGDYLLEVRHMDLFPTGRSQVHRSMFRQSLQKLVDCEDLHRDIYQLEAEMSLGAFGTPVEAFQKRKPGPDPLSSIAYCCIYWIDHLVSSNVDNDFIVTDVRHEANIQKFLETKFLYWLEALSLLDSIPESFASFSSLYSLLLDKQRGAGLQISCLDDWVKDARQFFLSHRDTIEQYPLQAYTSALVFSPDKSLVKKAFKGDMPSWITVHSGVGEQWKSCSIRLRSADNNSIQAMALSHDAKYIATIDESKTVRLWNRGTGRCMRLTVVDVDVPDYPIFFLAFSHNNQRIAVATTSGETHLLEVENLTCSDKIGPVPFEHFRVRGVQFSPCDTHLVLVSWSTYSLLRWNMITKDWRKVSFPGYVFRAFNITGEYFLTMHSLNTQTLKVCNTTTGDVLVTGDTWPLNDKDGQPFHVEHKAFLSPDGRLVARGTSMICIWDTTTREIVLKIDEPPQTLCFSHDNMLIAWSAPQSHGIRVAEVATGKVVQKMVFSDGSVHADHLMFFRDSKQLVSLQQGTVQIWDTWHFSESQPATKLRHYSAFVRVSPDENFVFWKIYDTAKMLYLHSGRSGETRNLITDADEEFEDIQFTPDWQFMSLRNANKLVRVFEVKTARCIQTIPQVAQQHCLSHDGQLVATIHSGPDSLYTVTVWCVSSGHLLHEFTTLNKKIVCGLRALFSLSGTYLTFIGGTHFYAWDITSGDLTYTFELSNPHDTWAEMDFDLFNHQDHMILSSDNSVPTIRSLKGDQHESHVCLPLEEEFPRATRVSKDDKLLVMYFRKSKQIWIWDVTVNCCRQRFNGSEFWLSDSTFHETNLGLSTSAGDVVIDPGAVTGIGVDDLQFSGVCLLEYNRWIAWRGQNVLMKPVDYVVVVSTSTSCRGKTIALGSDVGELIVLRFNL